LQHESDGEGSLDESLPSSHYWHQLMPAALDSGVSAPTLD